MREKSLVEIQFSGLHRRGPHAPELSPGAHVFDEMIAVAVVGCKMDGMLVDYWVS